MSSQHHHHQRRQPGAVEPRAKIEPFDVFHSQETVTTYTPTDSESAFSMSNHNKNEHGQQTPGETGGEGSRMGDALFQERPRDSSDMFHTADFEKADPNDDDDDDGEDALPKTMRPPNAMSNTTRNVNEIRNAKNGWDPVATTHSMVSSGSRSGQMDISSHTLHSGRSRSTGGVPVTNGTAQKNTNERVSNLCLEVPQPGNAAHAYNGGDYFMGISNHTPTGLHQGQYSQQQQQSQPQPQPDGVPRDNTKGPNGNSPFLASALKDPPAPSDRPAVPPVTRSSNTDAEAMLSMFTTSGDGDDNSIDSDITGLTGVFSSRDNFFEDKDWDFDADEGSPPNSSSNNNSGILVDDLEMINEKQRLYNGATGNQQNETAVVQVQAIPDMPAQQQPPRRQQQQQQKMRMSPQQRQNPPPQYQQQQMQPMMPARGQGKDYGAPPQMQYGGQRGVAPGIPQQQMRAQRGMQQQQQQQPIPPYHQQKQQQQFLQQPYPGAKQGMTQRNSLGTNSAPSTRSTVAGSAMGYSTRSPMPAYGGQKNFPTNTALDDSRGGRSRQGKSRVSFGFVHIRQFERMLSDNPSAVSGPSIGIGWRWREDPTYSLRDYERFRGPPKPAAAMLLHREERENLLLGLGYTRKHLAAAVRANTKAKNQRRQTVQNLRSDRMEEALEGTRMSFRKLFKGGGGQQSSSQAPPSPKIYQSQRM